MKLPATVGGKGVRGNGRQEVMVGRGTCSPPNVVAIAMLPRQAVGRWVRAWLLQSSLLTAGPV